MSQLEKEVSSLLDSVSDSNLVTVQNELTALFNKADSDFDALEKYGKLALKMVGNLEDDRKVLLLLAAALEMEWPEFQGGDGYWIVPSDLSSAATLLGLNNGHESLIEFSKKLNPCSALAYFELGLAAVSGASPSQVLFATNRSPVDPVLAIASLSESLDKTQILETLEKLDECVWLAAALKGANGWMWPEWQDAFDQVSGASRANGSFVEVLLVQVGKSNSEDSSGLKWIPEFIEEFEDWEGFYEDPSGMLELIVSNKELLSLAINSQWEGLIEALEEDFPEAMSNAETATVEAFLPEESKLAKFCSNCGTEFARAESRFCSDCGTQR